MEGLVTRELTLEEQNSKRYLEENAETLRSQLVLGEGNPDIMLLAMTSLMDALLECEQYRVLTEDCFEDISKICLVRIRMSAQEVARKFQVKVVNVYGTGMFIPIEGIFLSSETRQRTHYDEFCKGKKGSRFDISFLPEDVTKTHEFRLTISAFNGLFVPKKCEMVEWINSTRCLKYLDIRAEGERWVNDSVSRKS